MASKLGFTKTSQPKRDLQDITSWLSYFVSPKDFDTLRPRPNWLCVPTWPETLAHFPPRSLLVCLYPKSGLVISSELLQVPIFFFATRLPPATPVRRSVNLEAGSLQVLFDAIASPTATACTVLVPGSLSPALASTRLLSPLPFSSNSPTLSVFWIVTNGLKRQT